MIATILIIIKNTNIYNIIINGKDKYFILLTFFILLIKYKKYKISEYSYFFKAK